LKIKSSIRFFFKDLIRASALLWKADKAIASVNIVIQFVQALLPILSLYFMKQMIEAVVHANKPFAEVVPLIAAYGLIQLLLAAIGQYASYISTIHQHKLTDSLSAEVLEKAIEVDYEYYENPTYHDTLHLAQQQAIFKASQLLSNFNGMLLNSLSLVFLVGFFFTLHSIFALLFIVLSIPLAAIKWYSGFALLRLEKKFAPMEREANYLHQTLTGITSAKEVRVFGFGNYFIQKFKNIRHIVQKEKIKLNARLTWYSLFAEVGEIIAMTFIFGLLAKYTWQKVITVGAFVIYIQGFQRLQSTSKGFLQALVQIFQQRLFLKDLFAFLDLKTNTNVTGHKPFPPIGKGITVNHLSFTYPGTNRQVLNNVSLAIKPGSIVAIVGENGSGKSTLVKLLARLYEVQTGNIKVDDDLLSDIDMPSFRESTVFLFQDFEKYFLTVEENITLGDFRNDKNQADVETAATLSGAHSFIKNLSNGYKTRMGRMFRGSEQLSGGQWQKLALSRAFYRKAKLVILDEPTSALDASAESEVFVNVKEQLKDQMVILITHRLYNLKMADYIYVLKDGNIDQEGSFDDLISTPGQFKKLYETQKL
jgi:ATP-binding cassette subfamily B protein